MSVANKEVLTADILCQSVKQQIKIYAMFLLLFYIYTFTKNVRVLRLKNTFNKSIKEKDCSKHPIGLLLLFFQINENCISFLLIYLFLR